MKIRTDVNEVMYQKPARVGNSQGAKRGSPRETSSARIDSQLLQSISSRINSEKSLNEALSIAQASQTLLQKAMVVSSQLRNIASQAVVNGRVNSAELDVVLSDINAAFSDYNGGLTGPVRAFLDAGPEAPALPGIDNDIEAVRSIAVSLQEGRVPDMPYIDQTMQDISGKFERYTASIDQYTRLLRSDRAMREVFSSDVSGSQAMNSAIIVNNPETSLMAQGNLTHDGVQKVLS